MQTPLVDSANLFRLVQFFDILAAVVFAVSGALVASRKGMDVMGSGGSLSLLASAAAPCSL